MIEPFSKIKDYEKQIRDRKNNAEIQYLETLLPYLNNEDVIQELSYILITEDNSIVADIIIGSTTKQEDIECLNNVNLNPVHGCEIMDVTRKRTYEMSTEDIREFFEIVSKKIADYRKPYFDYVWTSISPEQNLLLRLERTGYRHINHTNKYYKRISNRNSFRIATEL